MMESDTFFWTEDAKMPQNIGHRDSRLAFEDANFMWRDEMRAFRLASEFMKADLALEDQKIRSTVVVFGSARMTETQKAKPACLDCAGYLAAARGLAHQIGSYSNALFEKSGHQCRDFVVCTGGGGGIMQAANQGAFDAGAPTIGLNIKLPREQNPNPYVTESLNLEFQYFAMRKMHFMMRAKAMIIFPGGFGTLDELFDVLTLIQTGKMPRLPILMFGEQYWRGVINFQHIVDEGLITSADAELIQFVATADQAFEIFKAAVTA
tara:strand:- start:31287 stop:32081 length:795 start_codon:yes stop_codon:yes gene_type:complete